MPNAQPHSSLPRMRHIDIEAQKKQEPMLKARDLDSAVPVLDILVVVRNKLVCDIIWALFVEAASVADPLFEPGTCVLCTHVFEPTSVTRTTC